MKISFCFAAAALLFSACSPVQVVEQSAHGGTVQFPAQLVSMAEVKSLAACEGDFEVVAERRIASAEPSALLVTSPSLYSEHFSYNPQATSNVGWSVARADWQELHYRCTPGRAVASH